MFATPLVRRLSHRLGVTAAVALVLYSVASVAMGSVNWALWEGARSDGAKYANQWTVLPKREPTKPVSTVASRPRVDRNPFCPTCAERERKAAILEQARREPLPLTLVATMEARQPEYSLATIEHRDQRIAVYQPGDLVVGDTRLLRVGRGRAFLDRGAGLTQVLEVDDPPPAVQRKREKKPDPKQKKKKKRKRGRREIDGAREAIECSGNQCSVDSRFVDKLAKNPMLLTKQARARPYSRKGVKGMRLTKVRRGTLPRLLGLRSGDVVTAVNGRPLDSLDAAIGMYHQLRRERHVVVEYARRSKGKAVVNRLEIEVE